MADAGGSSRARRGKRAREGTPAQVTNARVFDALPNEVSARVAAFLPPNEVATTLRLVSPAAAALYFPHRQVKLSQSVPVHAFAAKWTPEAARGESRRCKRGAPGSTHRCKHPHSLTVSCMASPHPALPSRVYRHLPPLAFPRYAPPQL